MLHFVLKSPISTNVYTTTQLTPFLFLLAIELNNNTDQDEDKNTDQTFQEFIAIVERYHFPYGLLYNWNVEYWNIVTSLTKISLQKNERHEIGLLDRAGTLYEELTGNSEASDGEYFTKCTQPRTITNIQKIEWTVLQLNDKLEYVEAKRNVFEICQILMENTCFLIITLMI